MLNPHHLKTFLAAASRLSFREAALGLHLAPSTVTAQIAALEAELGLPLFDRSARQVLLTEHGQRLVHHARRILDLEEEARRHLSGADSASMELAVRLSESLGIHRLPAILADFRRLFPNTRLNLATSSRHDLTHDLRHGVMDLALILSEPFAAPSITVEVLRHEELVVIAAPSSPLAGRAEAGPGDLRGLPLAITRHVWSARAAIEGALRREQVTTSGVVECTSLEVVKQCVMAGQAVSVAPRFAVEPEVRAGRLVCASWAEGPLRVPVILARDVSRWLSPGAAAFIQAARAHLGGLG